jgi:disulfide bond formation protein DsbB
VGAGIAGFHTGVERKWWKGLETCSNDELKADASIEEMRAALLQAETPRCDEISWSIFGVSLTNLNFVGSLAFFLFAAAAAAKQKRDGQD